MSAAPGADLRSEWEIPEHKGGHGSLLAKHMRCVVTVNRPVGGPMRTVNGFPMVLGHLGYPVPPMMDGTNRLKESVPQEPHPSFVTGGAA